MKELLKKLIQAESTEHTGELAVAKVIKEHFQRFGIDCQLDSWGNDRANVTAHIKSEDDKPGLLFACHIDVVPPGEQQWKYPPFSATEEDGKIYGRGACDMKGSAAALITAVCDLIQAGEEPAGDLIITCNAGEETDSCGAKKFVAENKDKLPEIAGVIIAEPTNFKVITAHRGILWLEVKTRGRTAHGSRPHTGVNAINSMRKFLDELDKVEFGNVEHPKLGKCSVSINTINAGDAINVVPDMCKTSLDIRTVPGESNDEIIEMIENIFKRLKEADSSFDAEVSIVRNVGALETDDNSEFVKGLCSVVGAAKTASVGYGTDGPFFAQLGKPVVVCGAADGASCHQPDEFVEIAELEEAVEVFKKIIREFL